MTETIFLISMPGGSEWIWIILAVLILFGGRKIPELARGLGKGMREFKDAKEGIDKENDIPKTQEKVNPLLNEQK